MEVTVGVYIVILCYFFSSVPSSPPTGLSGFNISSKEILVRWKTVPIRHCNGIITGYILSWKITTVVDDIFWNTTVTRNNSVTLRYLMAFTNYTIMVKAGTKNGYGASSSITIVTDEDSKYKIAYIKKQENNLIHFLVCHHVLLRNMIYKKAKGNQNNLRKVNCRTQPGSVSLIICHENLV